MALLDHAGGKWGEFQKGAGKAPPSSRPSSRDFRWEVNLSNTPGTGRRTPINASFAGERRKNRRHRRGDVSLQQSAEKSRGAFQSHVYIHVVQDKYGSFKKKYMCTNLTQRRVKHTDKCAHATSVTCHSCFWPQLQQLAFLQKIKKRLN